MTGPTISYSLVELLAQTSDEPATTRDVSVIVLLGIMATIVGILTGILTLGRWFKKWVREQAQYTMANVNEKLDTGNGQSIGRMTKVTHDKLSSVERMAVVNSNRIEALGARLDTTDARLTRHEYIGHQATPASGS